MNQAQVRERTGRRLDPAPQRRPHSQGVESWYFLSSNLRQSITDTRVQSIASRFSVCRVKLYIVAVKYPLLGDTTSIQCPP